MSIRTQTKQFNIVIVSAGVAVLLILGLLLYFGMGATGNRLQAYRGVAVEVEEARLGSITRRITAVGTLSANQSVVIRPQVHGVIKKINFQEGSEVKAGDILVEIDDRPYQAALKEAQARFINAKSQFERASKLAERNAGPTKRKDEALAEMQSAEARFEKAKFDVENTVIRAPFEGIIGLKEFSVGATVDERTDLVILVDVDPIKLDFRVPGQFIHYINRGQSITPTIDGFGGEIFKGEIEAIDARVDPLAHSIAVRGVIANPKGLLKPGLFARVSLVVGSKEKTLIIPESALLTSGDEQYVYRVVEGASLGIPQSIALKTIVTPGLAEEGNVEIVRGLNPGEKVITVGHSKIRDQVPVRIVLDADNPELGSPSESSAPGHEKTEATQSQSAPQSPSSSQAVSPQDQK